VSKQQQIPLPLSSLFNRKPCTESSADNILIFVRLNGKLYLPDATCVDFYSGTLLNFQEEFKNVISCGAILEVATISGECRAFGAMHSCLRVLQCFVIVYAAGD